MAGGVVAECEGAAFGVADEAVVVAGCDLLDGEAFQCGDFVGHVEGASWPALEGDSRYAELASGGEVLCARGKGEDATRGSKHESMLET